jgi:hypothetical protein
LKVEWTRLSSYDTISSTIGDWHEIWNVLYFEKNYWICVSIISSLFSIILRFESFWIWWKLSRCFSINFCPPDYVNNQIAKQV